MYYQGKNIDKREILKIKSKSLAAEIRIIRHEELALMGGNLRGRLRRQARCKRGAQPTITAQGRQILQRLGQRSRENSALREELYQHRQGLSVMARDTHIAYQLVRGWSYGQIEPTAKSEPNWPAINEMILKYGSSELRELAQKAKAQGWGGARDLWRRSNEQQSKAA